MSSCSNLARIEMVIKPTLATGTGVDAIVIMCAFLSSILLNRRSGWTRHEFHLRCNLTPALRSSEAICFPCQDIHTISAFSESASVYTFPSLGLSSCASVQGAVSACSEILE